MTLRRLSCGCLLTHIQTPPSRLYGNRRPPPFVAAHDGDSRAPTLEAMVVSLLLMTMVDS
ncbi:hypothetical protein Hdeb2414_s0136g00808901 [Helianthus debilis subsp. tardiflorus]